MLITACTAPLNTGRHLFLVAVTGLLAVSHLYLVCRSISTILSGLVTYTYNYINCWCAPLTLKLFGNVRKCILSHVHTVGSPYSIMGGSVRYRNERKQTAVRIVSLSFPFRSFFSSFLFIFECFIPISSPCPAVQVV